MKANLNLLSAAIILLVASCTNEYEPVFSESANERVRKAIEEYHTTLTTASDGWKAILNPGLGGAYLFYFEFKDNGTVTMVSDFSNTTAQTPMESTFVIQALQRPTLIFDSYSYIHYLSDPDGTANNGPLGTGLQSDFEFAVERVSGDSVILEGIKNQTKMTFVKASSEEKESFLAGQLGQSRANASNEFSTTSYAFIESEPGNLLPMGLNDATKIFTVFYLDESLRIQKASLPFSYSLDGILLHGNISAPNISFSELFYDANLGSYYILNSSEKVVVQSSASPITYPQALPPLVEALGTEYEAIAIYPSIVDHLSQDFIDRYQEADQNLFNTFGVSLGTVAIIFSSGNQVTVSYELLSGATPIYYAEIVYPRTLTSEGILTFTTRVSVNINDTAINTLMPLIGYFESNSFELEYLPHANIGELLTGAYPQADPNNHFFGVLE